MSSTNSDYIYFHLPITINGIEYGNHFSFGYRINKSRSSKSKAGLVDLHYTIQDPALQQSFNSDTKCWLYDGKRIHTKTMFSELCEIPKNKTFIDVYNELFIDYILIIIATPFIRTQKDQQDIQEIVNKIASINSSISAPPSSPTGGKKRVTKIKKKDKTK